VKYLRPGSVDQDAIRVYLRAIKGETLLTAAEECSLAEAIARGDRDARTRMIQANLRLVVKIAREFMGRGLGLEDLIGEGNIGLIRAAEQFEPRFGTRFSTYASFWIKQSIRQALSNSMAMIRLPAHVLGLLGRWRKAERALGRELDRTPSFSEVALSLGLNETQKLLLSRAQHARQLKLQSSVAAEEGRWSPVESCDPYGPPDLAVESLDDQHLLRSRMEGLDGRERIILTLRYGLENEMPMTLKEIGCRLGVTREWVRVIELKAVRKLRGEVSEEPGKATRRSISIRSKARAPKGASHSAKSSIVWAR
jgi:RNA polymerase primary sigma factor